MGFQRKYFERTRTSRSLHSVASQLLALENLGTSHDPSERWDPYPPFAEKGCGPRLHDVDGNEYLDYVLGSGSNILGHRPSIVSQAVIDAITEYGTRFSLPYELEIEAATKIVTAVPGVEVIRFANSAWEALATAIRLATAHTGRSMVMSFDGHCPSRPPLGARLITLEWNDRDAVLRTMAERGDRIAAVLAEPVVLHAGCVPPDDGFLEFLRDQAKQHDVLLVFDESTTGFRVSLGGAQEWYDVRPDLTVLANAMGAGFPAAALGGRREIMNTLGDPAFHCSLPRHGSLVQCAAVSATIEALSEPGIYDRQRAHGQRLGQGLRELAQCAGLPLAVTDIGLAVGIEFPVSSPDRPDAIGHCSRDMFRSWHRGMLLRGILFHPSPSEVMFLSMVHESTDIDLTLDAAAEVFAELANEFASELRSVARKPHRGGQVSRARTNPPTTSTIRP